MANLGTGLVGVYQTFVDSGGNTSQLPAEYPNYEFDNGMVGMSIKAWRETSASSSPSSPTLACRSRTRARRTTSSTAYAPINELPTIAELAPDDERPDRHHADRLRQPSTKESRTTRRKLRCKPISLARSSTSTGPA